MKFDLNLDFVPQNINDFLGEVAITRGRSQRLFKLGDYCKRLEDEMKKIDGFERELPLCMLILKDAIERVKKELMQCSKPQQRPKTHKFMDLKGVSEEEDGEVEVVKRIDFKNSGDNREWLTSVPSWGHAININPNKEYSESEINMLESEVEDLSAAESDNRKREVAFEEEVVVEQGKDVSLVLATPQRKVCRVRYMYTEEQLLFVRKKARRTWPPELHRLFLEALEHLGGWQAATPKKIKEFMKVEGLTSDEIKSHLQKYRLHVRNSSVSEAKEIWMAQEELPNLSMFRAGSPQCLALGRRPRAHHQGC
ncbi:transcription factor HHO2-like isoform X2 [Mangifera indica]|uniref:transcription factor HHO2-like isoform X2 n=1 Tax=Mangifera indica TaxID=29780 RepID=UPI001CFB1AE6|nr:transcription factor HHO2-like isoform X2 [Mangifera indica]